MLADALLTAAVLLLPPASWPGLFAAMGAATAAGMTAWGRWYATAVDARWLGRTFALAAATVAAVEWAFDVLGRHLRPDAAVAATLAPLALAWLALGAVDPRVDPSRVRPAAPTRARLWPVARFALFVALFSLVAGLSLHFFIVRPVSPYVDESLRRLPYVLGVLAAGALADRRGLQTPMVSGAGLLALAFLVGAWRAPAAQYVGVVLNGAAFGLLEPAPWLLLAANATPATAGRWFGWGLNLNVLPILAAGLIAAPLGTVSPAHLGLMAAVALLLAILSLHGADDPLRLLRGGPPDEPVEREAAPLGDLLERRYGQLLSPREVDVGRLAVLGVATREIAQRLYISENTVKTHLRSVYRKTGSLNRADLLRKLVSSGAEGPDA